MSTIQHVEKRQAHEEPTASMQRSQASKQVSVEPSTVSLTLEVVTHLFALLDRLIERLPWGKGEQHTCLFALPYGVSEKDNETCPVLQKLR